MIRRINRLPVENLKMNPSDFDAIMGAAFKSPKTPEKVRGTRNKKVKSKKKG